MNFFFPIKDERDTKISEFVESNCIIRDYDFWENITQWIIFYSLGRFLLCLISQTIQILLPSEVQIQTNIQPAPLKADKTLIHEKQSPIVEAGELPY